MSTNINATVKYQAREVETKYGKRINVVLITDNGEKLVQWGNPEDSNLTNLKKNQKVSLVKGTNNKIMIIPLNESTNSVNTYKPETWNDEVKKGLHVKAQVLLSYYEEVDRLVRQTMKDYKSEDSIRAIVTTVFLQSIRSV